MPAKDKRIDAYIAKAQPFARPVLKRMRALIHKACPDVEETIKWGAPSFVHHGPLFFMAAFKQHCAGSFWKATLLKDPEGYLKENHNKGGSSMGHLGRMSSLKDLPPEKTFTGFVKQHMVLNENGLSVKKAPVNKKPVVVPDALATALKKNAKARKVFDAFPPSHKREYAEWIAEAKTEETRLRRIKTAMEWIADGKQRNWKYMKKRPAKK